MMGRSNNRGKLVRHLKSGKRGRTYYNKGVVNGKIPVYFETEKQFIFEEKAILCCADNLEVCGFVD